MQKPTTTKVFSSETKKYSHPEATDETVIKCHEDLARQIDEYAVANKAVVVCHSIGHINYRTWFALVSFREGD